MDRRAKVELSSRFDVSMSMAVERFEGSPRSWGFIGAWCVRRCLVRFQKNRSEPP